MAPKTGDEQGSTNELAKDAVARAFGAENRARLLAQYFGTVGVVTPTTAWQHVYRLLLWIDRTTALAHCYESDKAQPGRPWYARSLAFHDWVSQGLGSPPGSLGQSIDWLFREATKDLASNALALRTAEYKSQRAAYEGRGFPEPGEDAELVAIVRDSLGKWLSAEPSDQAFRDFSKRIYAHITQENKRRNLVGEGFEDAIAEVIKRLQGAKGLKVTNRSLLHDLPGFRAPLPNEKAKKVDLALVGKGQRTLVSAKWSIRADREEQFQSDFEAYARLESAGQDFQYTLVTNEFDAARLKAACERRRQNALLFTRVVHINPDGVLAAYSGVEQGSVAALRNHIDNGRLMSLASWLNDLC